MHKRISFHDRLNTLCVQPKVTKTELSVLTDSQRLDKRFNRVVSTRTFQLVDRKKEMSSYKVSDFCLENLLSVGADINSTTLQMTPLQSVDMLEKSFNNLKEK